MDFSQFSNQQILTGFKKVVHTERKITHIVLLYINEIESRGLYLDQDCNSLEKFLIKEHGYSEPCAYNRVKAAQLLKRIPEISQKLEDGSLNLTQLTQVEKCLRKDNSINLEQATQVLQQIESKSVYETKQILAVEFNLPIERIEKLTPQADGSVRMEVTFSEEEMKFLKQAKDLLSHVVHNGSWKDLILHLAKKDIKKILGKEAFSSVLNPPRQNSESLTQSFSLNSEKSGIKKVDEHKSVTFKRKHIKTTTRRALLIKANNCCEYVSPLTKQKCDSRYQLQVDHRVPIAVGGKDESQNYRMLCRSHNLREAKRWGLFPPGG